MRIASATERIEKYIEQFNMASFLNANMLRHLQIFEFEAYSNIYIEHDEQHYLYFLVEGRVQCHHYHINGKLAVFAISEPFSAIGDLEILNQERVNSNVLATQRTVMLGVSRNVVQQYGTDDPKFLRFIISELTRKMYKSNDLQMIYTLSAKQRLAQFILLQSDDDQGAVFLPSKEALASLLLATPRHLNRVLRELVDEGVISDSYPLISILDKQALSDEIQ